MRIIACFVAILFFGLIKSTSAQELGLCRFDPVQLKFAGTPIDQARCLLRKVTRGGNLAANPATLPSPFDNLIGRPVDFTKQELRTYLLAKGILESDIGGSLDTPLSRAKSNSPTAPYARYFVIHDTSTPNCSATIEGCPKHGKLPTNMNKNSWIFNGRKLLLKRQGDPVAHVFVARTGISKTGHNFSVPWRAVRLESVTPDIPAKGLFLHVENVQPRIGLPAIPPPGKEPNDRIAPNPGFTKAQYKRLATVYVAASARRGEWLVPGFHAVIDSGISGAHDDPQNFDLNAWAFALNEILEEID